MAEKIVIDIFRKKDLEELSRALADPDSKLETGSAAAAVAAVSASLLCRAASITAKTVENNEQLDYICRNAEILRTYMLHLVDEDVKSRGPLNRAVREGDPRAIEAARQPAVSISAEIINMMGKGLALLQDLSGLCPRAAMHYLAESAELAMAAAKTAKLYIIDMSSYCSDETYRYVTRRENEMLLAEFEPMVKAVIAKAEAGA